MFAASKTASASTGGVTYIEDVFSTWLYTGNGSTQTITNGIDLSTKGGLVWTKSRSNVNAHWWVDTVRGVGNYIDSAQTAAQGNDVNVIPSFLSTGYTTGSNLSISPRTYASWTFRKQPKFFDVVTYTGNGVDGRAISHNLGAIPRFIIVKRTDAAAEWRVYAYTPTGPQSFYLALNTTGADGQVTGGYVGDPSATTFPVYQYASNISTVNANGGTYVAYLFASNAGGFGLAGTDNVISCGSWTATGGGVADVINLGFEPQWILWKRSNSTGGNWYISDNMRGMPVQGSSGTGQKLLYPNLSDAEYGDYGIDPTSTGFNALYGATGNTFIYIAIRRGPMKVPTTGTSVFGMSARSGTGANATVTGGQTDDAVLVKNRGSAIASLFSSRLTGTGYMVTSTTAAEVAAGTTILQANPWDVMDGVKVGTTDTITNATSNTYINYLFKRAPKFFDVVCYTGNDTSGRTVTHNLGAVPELMIVKTRSGVDSWYVYNASLGNTKYLVLNTTAAQDTYGLWNNTTPTASVFTLGVFNEVNDSTRTYVAYLFATLAGVSKVGTYTGNGTTQTIDCGLTAGARFVLIKKTSATGDWYVYDTARGMTTLTDPYWFANTSAAEVATLGSVTTVATGFAVNSAILAAINTNAATYIFLAVG